jgi:hypothetical protein
VRRVFWVALGATVGVLVVRRMTAAAQQFTPAGVQQNIGAGLSNLGDGLKAWAEAVREGMAEREVELRDALGLDGTNDDIDAHTFRS